MFSAHVCFSIGKTDCMNEEDKSVPRTKVGNILKVEETSLRLPFFILIKPEYC